MWPYRICVAFFRDKLDFVSKKYFWLFYDCIKKLPKLHQNFYQHHHKILFSLLSELILNQQQYFFYECISFVHIVNWLTNFHRAACVLCAGVTRVPPHKGEIDNGTRGINTTNHSHSVFFLRAISINFWF